MPSVLAPAACRLGLALGLAAALAPAVPVAAQTTVISTRPSGNLPSRPEAEGADYDGGNWLTFNKGYRGFRYSQLGEIDRGNIGALREQCRFDTGEKFAFRAGPIVHRGTMIFTTAHNTYAIDAATCALRWKHEWLPLRPDLQYGTNNGATVADGRVFRGTNDGYLLALDAATGQLLWHTVVADAYLGEYAVAAPLAWNGLVYLGKAGGDSGIRGEMMAFSATDGHKVWGFNTVPQVGEPGAETWTDPASLAHGGGGTWTTYSLNPFSNTLLIPVGNPGPDFNKAMRPGRNLYTNSLVALDATTGALKWAYQLLGPEDRDWDTSVVASYSDWDGRRAAAVAGKDGVLHVVDHADGKLLFKLPLVTQLNTTAEIPLAPGIRICPIAAVQWNGPAYSPLNNLLYLGAIDWCATAIQGEPPVWTARKPYLGWANGYGTRDPIDQARGVITAVDAHTGLARWRWMSDRPLLAGVTATAGQLLLTADLRGRLVAIDAVTGKQLRMLATGGPNGGGVISYLAGGHQRIAVATGFSHGGFAASGATAQIVVFGL
ncbi:pyrroloquinoline quinone-dependent dehydrogenase [Derxia gummosa]|uniref:Pyrroloquinoline quinone-dependent dehydrogenase n=1 Tax=Derxia gummosa DSM 723 TaxID=1121388 RepID=A0A8B6X8Q9_9BURK|nr:PQQ-binding-like beta-propeller repeat protein [Derxia gummosa]